WCRPGDCLIYLCISGYIAGIPLIGYIHHAVCRTIWCFDCCGIDIHVGLEKRSSPHAPCVGRNWNQCGIQCTVDDFAIAYGSARLQASDRLAYRGYMERQLDVCLSTSTVGFYSYSDRVT